MVLDRGWRRALGASSGGCRVHVVRPLRTSVWLTRRCRPTKGVRSLASAGPRCLRCPAHRRARCPLRLSVHLFYGARARQRERHAVRSAPSPAFRPAGWRRALAGRARSRRQRPGVARPRTLPLRPPGRVRRAGRPPPPRPGPPCPAAPPAGRSPCAGRRRRRPAPVGARHRGSCSGRAEGENARREVRGRRRTRRCKPTERVQPAEARPGALVSVASSHRWRHPLGA